MCMGTTSAVQKRGPIPTNDAGGGATGCHGNDEVEYARCVDGYQYNFVTEYCLNLKILTCSIFNMFLFHLCRITSTSLCSMLDVTETTGDGPGYKTLYR